MPHFSRKLLRSLFVAGAVVLLSAPAQSALAGLPSCPADCNGDFEVTINELIQAVTIALGDAPLSSCPAADANGDGEVRIDDLLAAVSAALSGCPSGPTPTATATATGSLPPTATATVTVTQDPATATPTVTETVPTPPTATATDEPTATATATESASTATPSATPISEPTDLQVMIDAAEVRLTWINPPPAANLPDAKVLRRLNAPVVGPDDPDATPVFLGEGNAASHSLLALLPDVPEEARVYHYAVFACAGPSNCTAQGAAATLTPTLAQVLRAGGYAIIWRHALADVCQDNLALGTAENPVVPDWWKSCEADCSTNPPLATARQISDIGRAQASTIGAAFDILGIPVGRVLSSEFCRTLTTAQLMDFGPTIELDPDITFFVYDEANRCAASYERLNQLPAAGTNTALIGHAGFPVLDGCPVLDSLAMAEAAVFRPGDAGGAQFITSVTVDEWATLLPEGPSGLSATVDEPHVRLTWTNGPGYTSVRLLRREAVPVEGPNDPAAQLVFAGIANTVLEPLSNLLPTTAEAPRAYFYAVYGCIGASCEATGSATMVSPTLAQVLRAGGYVIHWRHATATVCQDDLTLGTAATTSVPNWWKSCDADCPIGGGGTATARQLSDVGRAQAATIGAAFDARGFAVGRVVSSEFCRAVETAQLMDFGPSIEQSPAITYFVYDEDGRCADTFDLLAELPSAGTNTALISHAGNSCPPLSNLAMSEAAVYKPDGTGGATFVARVTEDAWESLP